jgi:hypothetical protein
MPLIDLKTTLKDLKFDTKAPYIVKDINNPPVYNSLSNEATRRQDDVLRLTRMLTDVPGAKFISNQALLQAFNSTNSQRAGNSVLTQVAAILGNTIISTGRAAAITLAQAGIEGSGVRLTLPQPSSFYYTQNNPGSAAAVSSPIVTNERGTETLFSSRNSRYAELQLRGVNNRAVGNVNSEDLNKFDPGSENYTDIRLDSDTISAPTKASEQAKRRGRIDVKLGPTNHFGGAKQHDAINFLDVGDQLENDDDRFVKVLFARYNSQGSYTGTKVFRAFIGNISDTFTAKWNANEYVGRMEQFFNYTGFTRTLTFPLQVPIFSEEEQPLVYNKVNSLLSHTAPQYTGNRDIPSGIITYLEIGDYLKTPGVINSIGLNITNDVQWSAGPKKFNGRSLIIPQVLTLTVQFAPIHEVTPQTILLNDSQLIESDYNKFRYIGNGDSLTEETETPADIVRRRAAEEAARDRQKALDKLAAEKAAEEAAAEQARRAAAEEARLAKDREYEEYARRNDLSSTPFFNNEGSNSEFNNPPFFNPNN